MATGVFMLGQIQGLLMTMRLWDALDILVVAFFFYRMYILVRDTRATALLKGARVPRTFYIVCRLAPAPCSQLDTR